jgi:hypothetical protein
MMNGPPTPPAATFDTNVVDVLLIRGPCDATTGDDRLQRIAQRLVPDRSE